MLLVVEGVGGAGVETWVVGEDWMQVVGKREKIGGRR
jgi:hypothetical protein